MTKEMIPQMQEEVKAATEEAVSALQKLADVTGCLAFRYNKFNHPRFEVQLDNDDFYRLAAGPIIYAPQGKSAISDKEAYEATFMVNDVTFLAIFYEDEVPEDARTGKPGQHIVEGNGRVKGPPCNLNLEAKTMDAIKITVERGNMRKSMKKAAAYCDTGMFCDGKCKEADCPMEDDLNICCAVCDSVFDCQGSCPRVEVQNDEP